MNHIEGESLHLLSTHVLVYFLEAPNWQALGVRMSLENWFLFLVLCEVHQTHSTVWRALCCILRTQMPSPPSTLMSPMMRRSFLSLCPGVWGLGCFDTLKLVASHSGGTPQRKMQESSKNNLLFGRRRADIYCFSINDQTIKAKVREQPDGSLYASRS